MIETAIRPLPNVTVPIIQEPGKAGSPEKMAAMAQGETPSKPEATPEQAAMGMHLDVEGLSKLQNDFSQLLSYKNTVMEYEVDKETRKMLFRIRDKETKEVIRQFPPEQLVEFAHRIIELLDGKVFNTQA